MVGDRLMLARVGTVAARPHGAEGIRPAPLRDLGAAVRPGPAIGLTPAGSHVVPVAPKPFLPHPRPLPLPVVPRTPRLDVPFDARRFLDPRAFERIQKFRPRPGTRVGGCPAGGMHDHSGSAAYTLACDDPAAPGQPQWRWCRKCQGLAFGPGADRGRCAMGGEHDHSGSAAYTLAMNMPDPNRQEGWRWCSKCQAMAFGGNGPGPCPAGGTHEHGGSGAYSIPMNHADAPGQTGWRWCRRCQGLAYGGADGVRREELGLPVAPGQEVDDAAPYEAAAGGGLLHLPQYRLGRLGPAADAGYEVRFGQAADGTPALTLRLGKLRAETIPAATPTAEMPHELMLRLTYRLTLAGGARATKELPFQEIGETADGLSVVATLRFATPAERDQALSAMTDPEGGAGLLVTRVMRVAIPVIGSGGMVRPVTRALAETAEPNPFFFNPATSRDLFEGPRPDARPSLSPHQVEHGGRFHTYWQDIARPGCAYYLPDAMRLARRGKPAPFLPVMAARLAPGASGPEDACMVLEFAATPFTDPTRIAAARDALRARLLPGDAGDIDFEPLQAEGASLWLALPGSLGPAERPGALIDLRSGMTHSETLPLAAFTAAFEALLGASVALMRGEIRLDLGGGAADRIPFEARFDRMDGELTEVGVSPGPMPGSFALVLSNAIESTLAVDSLAVALRLPGGGEVPARIAGPARPLPAALAPGETLSFTVEPEVPLPEGAAPQIVLDLGGLRVIPDRERIWDAILDTTVPAELGRGIRVKLFPPMFDAPGGDATQRALAVLVQFEGGPTVELTPEKPETELRIPLPVRDLVLRTSAPTPGYRYRATVIRPRSRAADPAWHDETSELLVPQLPPEA